MFVSMAAAGAATAPAALAAPAAPAYAVTATIPVGAGPAPVAVNSQTGRVYVGNQSDSTVSVLTTSTNTVAATVPVGGSATAIAVNPVTDKTYVTTSTPGWHTGELVEIDHTNAVVASRQLQQDGDGPHFGVAVNSGTDTVYASHFYGGSVSEISGATLATTSIFGAGPIVFGVAADEQANRLYVANVDQGTVTVVDGLTHAVLKTISIGGRANFVAVDPSRHRVYANTSVNTVAVIDTTTLAVAALVPVGRSPQQVGVDPSTGVVYVPNNLDNTVSVIDEATDTVTATVPVGQGPSAVAVDPGTHTAYVTNSTSNTVSVIRTMASTPVITNLPTGVVAGGSFTATVDTTGDGTPSVSSSTPDVCQATGLTVSFVGAGNCTLTAAVTAGPQYGAGTGSPQTIAVGQGSQTITFTSTAPGGAVVGGTYPVAATGGASTNPVSFSIDPTSTSTCSISASTVTFDHVGSCVVDANQAGNGNYLPAPQAQQTINVGKAPQTITFAPLTTPVTVDTTQGLNAVGGASGNLVTFTVATGTTGSACSITGTTLSFDHAGTCVVAADQAGNADYTAAPEASQTISVGLAPTSATLVLNPGVTTFGQTATATATVGGAQAGTIQFSVDGTPVGAPVTVSNRQATSPALGTLAPGAHQVGAGFTPLDATRYAPSSATPQSLVVDPAATTPTIAIRAGAITATVTPVAPGSGTPTGTVTFSVDGRPVGTAALSAGVATLAYDLPTSKDDEVAVQYPGDVDFLASSASTTRHNPTITATLSSAYPKSTSGWFHSDVTVSFTCTTNGADLVTGCPQPVTLTKDGAAQSVSRTITALDGGAATVSITGIDIDETRPSVAISGVSTRAPYFAAAPLGQCTARDGLSGVASCTLTRSRNGAIEIYTATATDQAGNVSTTRLTALVSDFVIQGASWSNGRYVVRPGHSYSMLAAVAGKPRYIDAMPNPKAPRGRDNVFVRTGRDRWALGVTFGSAMLHRRYWNIGVLVAGRLHVVAVQVVR